MLFYIFGYLYAYLHIYIYIYIYMVPPPCTYPFPAFLFRYGAQQADAGLCHPGATGCSKIRWCSYTYYQSCSCTQSQNRTARLKIPIKASYRKPKTLEKPIEVTHKEFKTLDKPIKVVRRESKTLEKTNKNAHKELKTMQTPINTIKTMIFNLSPWGGVAPGHNSKIMVFMVFIGFSIVLGF